MSDQAGAGVILRPAGASDGSARWSAALKEPFRSEPQMERMFKVSHVVLSKGGGLISCVDLLG